MLPYLKSYTIGKLSVSRSVGVCWHGLFPRTLLLCFGLYLLLLSSRTLPLWCRPRISPGGGDSDMKWTGMLIVSHRGVNFGFWSRLGCSGQNVIIFSRQGLV